MREVFEMRIQRARGPGQEGVRWERSHRNTF